MANTAWGVISWVPVEMDIAEWHALRRNFRHSVTSIHGEPDEYGCHYGYTLWKADGSGDRPAVGLAWDWREMQPGVVGQDDPMSILTNVRLLRDGQSIGPSQKVLELNDAVYQIGWQRVARRQLQLRGADPRAGAHAGELRITQGVAMPGARTVIRPGPLAGPRRPQRQAMASR